MVVRPVSAGYYHRYRRGIAIPLANTDTDTNTNYASGIIHHPGLGRLYSLTPSSMQPEIDESPSQADHAHPPTLVDNDHHNTPQTSYSPSKVESTPVTEYQE